MIITLKFTFLFLYDIFDDMSLQVTCELPTRSKISGEVFRVFVALFGAGSSISNVIRRLLFLFMTDYKLIGICLADTYGFLSDSVVHQRVLIT